jgi:hypothetical protein
MKLNVRHKIGLQVAKLLPFSLSWPLLKIPSGRVLAGNSGHVVLETKEDISRLIPREEGSAGEIRGSEVFAFDEGYSTHWGANLTREGGIITDLSRQGIGTDKDHFAFGKPRVRKARRIKGNVATLTIEHRSNYFHFLCDAVARLQLVENLKSLPDYIYVQANQKYQREILARLGYQPNQIIDSATNPFIQADQLWVPSYVSNFSFLTENSVAFLRSRLGNNLSTPAVSRGRAIYISRKDTPRRKMLNEDKLLDRLSHLPVEPVVLSELSVAEQIELFEKSDAMVTITGAGLANLIFAPKHLFLVLITPPNWFGASALDIIKPFGLNFSNIVLSDYPEGSDPFAQHMSLTDQEMEAVAQSLAGWKKNSQASSGSDPEPIPRLESPR